MNEKSYEILYFNPFYPYFNLSVFKNNRCFLLRASPQRSCFVTYQTRDIQSYARFSAFVNAVESETDWHIVLTSGYRTEEEQAVLNEKDARNADAGQSKHNFGKAIDVNFYKNKGVTSVWLMKNSPKKRWEDSGILKLAEKNRLKWGGNFKNYYDPVHFEVE